MTTFAPEDFAAMEESQLAYMKREYDSCFKILEELMGKYLTDTSIPLNSQVVAFYKSNGLTLESTEKALFRAASKVIGELQGGETDVNNVVHFYNIGVVTFWRGDYRRARSWLSSVYIYNSAVDMVLSRKMTCLLIECNLKLGEYSSVVRIASQALESIYEPDYSEFECLKEVQPEEKLESRLIETQYYYDQLIIYKLKALIHMRKFIRAEAILRRMDEDSFLLKTHLIYLKAQLHCMYCEYDDALIYLKQVAELNSVDPEVIKPFKSEMFKLSAAQAKCDPFHLVMLLNNVAVVYASIRQFTTSSLASGLALCIDFSQQSSSTNTASANQLSPTNVLAPPIPPASPYVNKTNNLRPQLIYNHALTLVETGALTGGFEKLREVTTWFPQSPFVWNAITQVIVKKHILDYETAFAMQKPTRNLVLTRIGEGMHRKMVLAPSLTNNPKDLLSMNSASEQSSSTDTNMTFEYATTCVRNSLICLNRIMSESKYSPSSIVKNVNYEGVEEPPRFSFACYPAGMSAPGTLKKLHVNILLNGAFVNLKAKEYADAHMYLRGLQKMEHLTVFETFLVHNYLAEVMIARGNMVEAQNHLSPALLDSLLEERKTELIFMRDMQLQMMQMKDKPQVNKKHESALPLAIGVNNDVFSLKPPARKIRPHPPCDTNDFKDDLNNAFKWPELESVSLKQFPCSPYAMRYNLACLIAMQNGFEVAESLVEEVLQIIKCCPPFDHVLYARCTQLRIWLKIAQGREGEAIKIVKQECPQWKDRSLETFERDEKLLVERFENANMEWPF